MCFDPLKVVGATFLNYITYLLLGFPCYLFILGFCFCIDLLGFRFFVVINCTLCSFHIIGRQWSLREWQFCFGHTHIFLWKQIVWMLCAFKFFSEEFFLWTNNIFQRDYYFWGFVYKVPSCLRSTSMGAGLMVTLDNFCIQIAIKRLLEAVKISYWGGEKGTEVERS